MAVPSRAATVAASRELAELDQGFAISPTQGMCRPRRVHRGRPCTSQRSRSASVLVRAASLDERGGWDDLPAVLRSVLLTGMNLSDDMDEKLMWRTAEAVAPEWNWISCPVLRSCAPAIRALGLEVDRPSVLSRVVLRLGWQAVAAPIHPLRLSLTMHLRERRPRTVFRMGAGRQPIALTQFGDH